MTFALSLLLLTLGAILVWAVDFELGALNVDYVGVILLLFGGLGLVAALVGARGSRGQAGTSL